MDKAYRRHLITHPGKVQEQDMSFDLLMDIFKEKFGYKCHNQRMRIGGINFHCKFKKEFSNSGKESDWNIRITSIDHFFEKKSRFHANKRQTAKLKAIIEKAKSK